MPSQSARPLPVLLLVLLLLAGGAAVWAFLLRADDEGSTEVPLWTVEKTPLRVTVLETGSVEALEQQTITSSVEGRAAILYIVPEGTLITAKDVAEKKVLVELDTSNLQEDLNRKSIDLAQAISAHKNAASNLEIQRQQNASEIRQAELDVRFARLDLERYVGKALVPDLLEACACDLEAVANPEGGTTNGGAPPASPSTASERLIITLLANELLEGEAKQTIRRLDSDIGLAEEEFRRAQVKRDWTKRLLEKGYVSRDEEEADRIALERRRIELDRSRIAREQFAAYDFRKDVESLLSDLVKYGEQLDRTIKRARSSEEKSVADVRSRSEQEILQRARYEKLQKQIAAATIRATNPGLVVYASSQRRRRWGGGERIQEGTMVQERQPIINIPDLAKLGVKVSIHESVIERVKEGQRATILVDALPDRPVPGVVHQVARLPDPPDSWLNPDLKVYSTEIRLDHVPPELRPGMSAKTEVLVADLPEVTAVPVQAVAGTADRPVVWVMTETGAVEREVGLGLSNDTFVAIESGLEPGERVLLAPPRAKRLAGNGAGGRRGGRGRGDKAAPKSGQPAGKKGPPQKDASGGAARSSRRGGGGRGER